MNYNNLNPDRQLIKEYFKTLNYNANLKTPWQKFLEILNKVNNSIIKIIGGTFKFSTLMGLFIVIFVLLVLGFLFFFQLKNLVTILLVIGISFYISNSNLKQKKPPVSDKQIDEWLYQDLVKLYDEVPKKLDVILREDLPKNTLAQDNMNVVEYNRGLIKIWGVLKFQNSFPSDYYCEKGYDDNKYRYSHYLIISIALCKNFLAYYECYWNFINGSRLKIDTEEYLYDSIVSLNYHESSSAFIYDEFEIVYDGMFSISTQDGNKREFPLKEIKIIQKSQSSEIEAQKIVSNIRQFIRQRRIDVKLTKPVDNEEFSDFD